MWCNRSTDRRTRAVVLVGVVLVILVPFFLIPEWISPDDSVPRIVTYDSFSSRHLLGLSNCTPLAVEQFPKDFFSRQQRVDGAVVLHIFLAIYMFIALAIVCDDYFVPSCEHICEVLKLQDDVAGATFMAAGSSAPELATATIGVFIAKDDIGLSAVVGSAVYNVMFVISLCALFAGSVVYLNWWPLFRDCMFYTLSIILLVVAIMDESVHWYEAVVFLLMYALYIALMCFNPRIEAWIVPKFPSLTHRTTAGYERKRTSVQEVKELASAANNNEFSEDTEITRYGGIERESLLPSNGDGIEKTNAESVGEDDDKDHGSEMHQFDMDDDGTSTSTKSNEASPAWVWAVPKQWYKKVLWVISWPLILLMFISIPDCRQLRWRKWFILTFTMSILWIGLFSYLMVWMITVVGHTWNIPDSVMSLTLIAAGSSVPDAIASLIVVREGHGDMAVSNAVGSNVFDILLCLGLPWFLQTTVVTREPVQVYSAGLTYSALTLLSTVVLLLVMTHINRWRLTRIYGALLMIIYVAFNVLSCLYELNMFGYVHPPECASTD